VIILHSIKGQEFAINGELIERVEQTPETHILLSNGTSYMAQESLREVVRLDREDRAEVQALAARFVRNDIDGENGIEHDHPVASIRSIASAPHEPKAPGHDGQPVS
jgi:flagellar protein FlbD